MILLGGVFFFLRRGFFLIVDVDVVDVVDSVVKIAILAFFSIYNIYNIIFDVDVINA